MKVYKIAQVFLFIMAILGVVGTVTITSYLFNIHYVITVIASTVLTNIVILANYEVKDRL